MSFSGRSMRRRGFLVWPALSGAAILAAGGGLFEAGRYRQAAILDEQILSESRAEIGKLRAEGSAASKISDNSLAALKFLVAANAGILANDSDGTVAEKLVDQLHHATTWDSPFLTTPNDGLRYIQTIEHSGGNLCSSLCSTLAWELSLFGIPSRSVAFGSKEFAEGTNDFDSHVVVDALIGGKVIAFDPTFNSRYTCGDNEQFLGGIGMHKCVASGAKLNVKYISPPQAGRGLADYYTPIEPLLYAVSATSDDDRFPSMEFPSEGWLAIANAPPGNTPNS